MEKHEGKRPLPTPRRRWTDNITVDLHEVRGVGVDWIDSVQDRDVTGACECGTEHSGSIKCGEFLDWPRNFAYQRGLCSTVLLKKVKGLLVRRDTPVCILCTP